MGEGWGAGGGKLVAMNEVFYEINDYLPRYKIRLAVCAGYDTLLIT